MQKISKDTNPVSSGRYLVFYIPYGDYKLATWEFGSWDASNKKWYMYIPTAGTYRIAHWEFLPLVPYEESCKEGMDVDNFENYTSR